MRVSLLVELFLAQTYPLAEVADIGSNLVLNFADS